MSEWTDLQDHLATSDREMWLGVLVWFSVSETVLKHEELVKALLGSGLPRWLPRVPENSDVFRRVATAAQRKRQPTGQPGMFENYLIREVPSSKGVLKKIVCETVDTSGKKLGYHECYDITFDRTTGSLNLDSLGKTNPVADLIAATIEQDYHAQRGCVNGYRIRELIRKMLLSINATNVRGSGGGVYFVAKEHLDVVESLERLASKLPNTVDIHSLPLVDDAKQRQMVRKAFEAETEGEIQTALAEIAALHDAGKPISTEKFASFVERYQQLQSKHRQYTSVLETSLDTAAARLKILKLTVMKLTSLNTD